jgi:hypothetical protein
LYPQPGLVKMNAALRRLSPNPNFENEKIWEHGALPTRRGSRAAEPAINDGSLPIAIQNHSQLRWS